jgi:hypothetical protein
MSQTREFWVYATSPVDYWGGWQNLKQWLENGLSTQEDGEFYEGESVSPEALAHNAFIARKLVTSMGWEGDGIWQFSMLPVPATCDSLPLLAVKQSNNGTCFFCSPVRLPHLVEDGEERAFSVNVTANEQEKMQWFAAFDLEASYSSYRQRKIHSIADWDEEEEQPE